MGRFGKIEKALKKWMDRLKADVKDINQTAEKGILKN